MAEQKEKEMNKEEKKNQANEEEREAMIAEENQEIDQEGGFEIQEEVKENEQVAEMNEVDELKKANEDLEKRLLRSIADFENYKKRTKVEKEDLAKYANARLIGEILPIIDNFKRAIDSSHESKNFDSLIEGVEMVYRQLEELLKKEGLEAIEAVGKPFNPEFHQAVMQVEMDDYESGVVVEELQKGYKLKEKVIRPSMVKVNA